MSGSNTGASDFVTKRNGADVMISKYGSTLVSQVGEYMKTVDLRGVRCPTNFVKAKLVMEMADPGETVEFYLDEGEPVNNVPRSLEGEGHIFLNLRRVDGYCVLTVKKIDEEGS
jgi:tRNA 2-thiouridine synthesizing protein A